MADRHAEAAQELLRRILRREGEVVSSPGMAEDLAAHGVPLPPRARAARDGEKFDVVVCAGYLPWMPLIFPDNKSGRCATCGDGVQWRPDAPRGRRLCAVCALREERGDA